MAKKISMVRITEEEAEILREKAIELTIKSKEVIKESELVHFLIQELAERIDIDKDGFFVKEEDS